MKHEFKETKLFCLAVDEHVYIGRTTAQKISAICYSHARGDRETTRDYFGFGCPYPKLYILDRITAHSTVTYRHVVAWVHVFLKEGYHVLNCGDVLDHAADLCPETAVIVDEILMIPLEEHLAKSHYAKYKDADSRPPLPVSQVHTTPISEPATAKLTIRLSKAEKNKFDQAAQALHLTHRETLQYLLQFSPVEDMFLALMQQHHETKRTQQKNRIAELEKAVAEQREKLEQQAESHKKYVSMVKRGIGEYMDYFDTTSPFPLSLEVDWYDQYMRNCETDFVYPEKENIALIRPVAILRGHGRNPALFVLGVTVTGQCIKLRYYPKQEYVGLFLTNYTFGVRGSVWLMGWQRAEENVMQLMFALPLQIQVKYNSPMDVRERLDKMTEKLLDEVE